MPGGGAVRPASGKHVVGFSKTGSQYAGAGAGSLPKVRGMAEVISPKHGRRRADIKRSVQPYVLVNVLLGIGLAIAIYVMTR